MSSLRMLLCIFICLMSVCGVRAQDNDYLKHRKFFDICSIKKQCFGCHECNQERYTVKLQNNTSRNIKSIYYKFYSPVFNKIIEKEAKISGDRIESKRLGTAYVCVLDVRHWIFSKILYEDGSTETFTIKERLENFIQEADESDCND